MLALPPATTAAETILYPIPGQTLTTRRVYIQHRQQTVVFLQTNYAHYTLAELEQLLGLPWLKIKKLAERHGIRKRAPNKRPRCNSKGHSARAEAVAA